MERDAIINELYNRYKTNGFITEDQALDCFIAHQTSLALIDSITEQLLALGVIIRSDDIQDEDDEDVYDKTRTDYDNIFREVLQISPELKILIEYIKTVQPPQNREWQLLIPQAQDGNNYARNRLFDMYMRVVIKISLRFHKESNYELDDIIQVGAMGLLRAIKAYDFSKHGSFVSYMPLWVSQYISRAISDLARSIRLPVHIIERIRIIERVMLDLEKKSPDVPTIDEIASFSGMTEETVEALMGYYKDDISIEELVSIDDDGFNSFEIVDPKAIAVEHFSERNDLRETFNKLFETLKEKEANVLKARYGFDNGKYKTLEEVGQLYGVTRERIRQIETKAIKKLQHPSKLKKLVEY